MQRYNMIEPGDHVVAGVSGGADSVCLLVVLCKISEKLPFTLEVVHVNHGLRREAAEEAEYVKTLCKERGIVCHQVEADVRALAKEWGMGEEEAGRQLRYDVFNRICERAGESHDGAVKIAVAHHQNDRAETMLFHLFRGTGTAGLCGIKPVRDNVIRPLLCVSRDEIEEYLIACNMDYCHDASNDMDNYSRNKIRHHILPCAEEIVGNSVEHMNRTAEVLEEVWDYVEAQTTAVYDKCVVCDKKEIRVDVVKLTKEASILQKNVLMEAIGKIACSKKDITARHIEAVMELLTKPGSHEVDLPYGVKAKKQYDILSFQKSNDTEAEVLKEITITVPMTLKLPDGRELDFSFVDADIEMDGIGRKKYTKWFDYDKIVQSLVLRSRQTGDYLTINNTLSKKTLKEYMIEEKIPKDDRDYIPVLADGKHIIWVLGYRISENYKVNENTKRILQVQLRGGQ